MTTLGKVNTGVQTSIKQSATDAGKAAATQEAKDEQEADKAVSLLGEEDVIYHKSGSPVFNCFTAAGKPICFMGGSFIVVSDDPFAAACIETLDAFVAQGVLTKQVGA